MCRVLLKKIVAGALLSTVLLIQSAACSDEGLLMSTLYDAGYDGNFSIFGSADFTSICIHQAKDEEVENRNLIFRGSICLKYLNTINGCAYGFQSEAKPQSNLMRKHEAIFKTMYGFLKSDRLGEFRAGFVDTAANEMAIDGFTFGVGFQGPGSGDLGDFYNPSAGAIVDTGVSVDDGKAAKLVWYSPVIKGFSFGASYTFNGKRYAPFKRKHTDLSCEDDECWAYSKNVFTVAGMYEYGSENAFNAKFSLAGWFGEGKAGSHFHQVRGVRAYQVGAILGYKDFKVAFGYSDNGKSLISKRIAEGESPVFDPEADYSEFHNAIGLKHGADAGKIYSVGLLYNRGNLSVSSGYFRSVVKYSDLDSERVTSDIFTLAAEYQVEKNIKIYAEYDNIVTRTCDRARVFKKTYSMPYTGSNKANVFMIGTKINL